MYTWGFGAYSAPPSGIQTVLQNASANSGVPYPILQSLAYQESSYNPSAVSSEGAQGLLQVMPATGTSLGLTNPFDAQQNANAGASYLASLYKQYGNWNDALVAYNQGPGALASQGPFQSSQNYASTILSNAGVSQPSPATGAFVGPPDVFGGASVSPAASPDFGTSILSAVDTSVSGVDPLLLGGLALAAIGLIFLAA